MQPGVDAVFHGLGGLHRHAAKMPRFMDHLEEKSVRIRHLDTWRVHFRVNVARAVHLELSPILRVGQAWHGADYRNRAVGAHITVHAGLGAKWRVARLTHYDHPIAFAVIHVGITGRRPFD